MIEQRIGFLGAGKMATALAQGLVRAGLTQVDRVLASDVVPAAAEAFRKTTGCGVAAGNDEVLKTCQIIFLAVKPQQVSEVLAAAKPLLSGKHLLISIAAGVTLDTMQAALAPGVRLVRVMPNTPALVGQSASAFAVGPGATPDDAALVEKLLTAVGIAYRVDESLLDAVTGLSGSGPAFVYVMIEALADGGVRMGLPRAVAQALAAQTVRGAAEMVLVTGKHPGVLKDEVASPGGTTIAGLQALERGAVRADLINAVQAAARRSAQLGRKSRRAAEPPR